jgi:hypothetical protein
VLLLLQVEASKRSAAERQAQLDREAAEVQQQAAALRQRQQELEAHGARADDAIAQREAAVAHLEVRRVAAATKRLAHDSGVSGPGITITCASALFCTCSPAHQAASKQHSIKKGELITREAAVEAAEAEAKQQQEQLRVRLRLRMRLLCSTRGSSSSIDSALSHAVPTPLTLVRACRHVLRLPAGQAR